MTANQPDDVVEVSSELVECEEDCVSGTFNWIPGEAIQELLQEVPSSDRAELIEMLATRAHDFLGIVAAAAMAYDYSADDSALEKAHSLLHDAAIELNAQLGIMEMEATLAHPHEEEPDPNAS